MPLRDFREVEYLPILSVRPAEMSALEELPERDKDMLLPHVIVRPWLSANEIRSTLARIERAYGTRPLVAELASGSEEYGGTRRAVHDQLDALRDPTDGFANWCDFIEAKPNYIPALQITRLEELGTQVRRLAALNRGLVLRLPENALGQAVNLVRLVSEISDPTTLCVILDFERQTRQFQTKQVSCANVINAICALSPQINLSVSASTFPDSFVGIESQEIFERTFFQDIKTAVAMDRLIYSDRGSARVERQSGGSGAPAPRVDLALAGNWYFYREEGEEPNDEERTDLYERAAARAVASSHWDPALRVWGTQQIEQTALGIPGGISSPLRSTSARINIHLHQQTFYNRGEDDLHDTDEDWTD